MDGCACVVLLTEVVDLIDIVGLVGHEYVKVRLMFCDGGDSVYVWVLCNKRCG